MQAERQTSVERSVAELVVTVRPEVGSPPQPNALLSDLGFDSLACADLAVAVEERFGVRLADLDVQPPRTVGELAARVQEKVPPRTRFPEGLGRLQGFTKETAGRLLRWWYRMEVVGEERVPPAGPVILAANHRSMLDIPVHVVASPRPLVFMAKHELFADPFRRWLWRVLGGFPVRREIADIRSIDVALAVLERGEVLGIYPEGKRSLSGEMLPFLNGAAWIALRTGAPLVPCGIRGTGRGEASRVRKRVRVAFGEPITVEPERDPRRRREKADALTAQLLEAITELLA